MAKSFLYILLPFLSWMPKTTAQSLRKDLLAGLTGAVVVLPQGIAFSTIAGLPVQYGLYTAMVTPIFAALFGSSLHLISGPTTAISIVVFSTVSQFAEPNSPAFIQATLTVTFLAGVYQLAFGLARLGVLVNFVSHTVVIGFTAGAAVLIATSQLQHVLGVDIPRGENFLGTWRYMLSHLDQINWQAGLIAVSAVVTIIGLKWWSSKIPHLLLGLIAGSVVCYWLQGQTSGVAMVGTIPAQLPPISMPELNLQIIRELAPPAFAIALLGLIEAVSISRAIAVKSHQRINGNQEFIGQGISNIAGSFFSSYAGSGSFTRSGINYASGAQSPLSAIFAAGFLMLIVLLVSPLTAYLPKAAMGGVILMVAFNLIDTHHIHKIFKISQSEKYILIVTFASTLFLHLEFAIYIGVLLSLVVFLARTSVPDMTVLAPDPEDGRRRMTDVDLLPLKQCPQLKIVRIDMSIYFGSLDNVRKRLAYIYETQGVRHILLIGTGINFIDMAGAEMLIEEQGKLKRLGGGLYFCRLKRQVYHFLDKSGLAHELGKKHFFQREIDAIGSVFYDLDEAKCATCQVRIFKECNQSPFKGD